MELNKHTNPNYTCKSGGDDEAIRTKSGVRGGGG